MGITAVSIHYIIWQAASYCDKPLSSKPNEIRTNAPFLPCK
jgi:hypothetical protein